MLRYLTIITSWDLIPHKLLTGKKLFEIIFNEFQERNFDELESIVTEIERN